MRRFILASVLALLSCHPMCRAQAAEENCDLLIVGGNESAVACAVQAARLGVPRIVLVNDIDWLGGQFSAEAVGCMDEWTGYRGKRVNFPRSGLFLEMVERIHQHNGRTYGVPRPGNAFCGTETIEPAAAAQIMEELIAPYAEGGTKQIKVLRGWQPGRVIVDENRVSGVTFERSDGTPGDLTVAAKLTVDSSDWGDVIRMSGARYGAGADPRSRFGEPSAPENPTPEERNEMNPISWCVVLRETDQETVVPAPQDYDARKYDALVKTRLFVDSDMSEGIYAMSGWSVYTHRRLVDRFHFGFPKGTEATFLNWPVQDYPLYDFPWPVAEALEKTGAGASRKNIVNLTPAQRRIVFEDAKRHALGMLHWLQTEGRPRFNGAPRGFQFMELTNEFGTADRLPPKPYVREGLRLEALSMLKEQDIRAEDRNPKWAKVMPPDAVFGFQFNIDFHPTRRKFLGDSGNAGPWVYVQTKTRNWHTDTDRAMLSLRSLVPVERDGLLGASKNIGVSSIVQSALRLHGQMMLCGQAAGTVSALCLRDGTQPRELARDWKRVRECQLMMARGAQGHPGVLLWPYQDLAPDDLWFESANLLAVLGVWQGDEDSLDFRPYDMVTRGELARNVTRACKLVQPQREWATEDVRRFSDVTDAREDRVHIQSLCAWSGLGKDGVFHPEERASMGMMVQWLVGLKMLPPGRLDEKDAMALMRKDLARVLWSVVKDAPEVAAPPEGYLSQGNDSDGDGMADLDDAMPFDKDNDRVPDALDVVDVAPAGGEDRK